MKYLALILLLIFTGCAYPRDPLHSFKKAQESGLKVGVAINPPFTEIHHGKLSGKEIKIINGFAQEKNLRVKYTVASESDLIEQLEKQQLYIIVGGFGKKTIWKKKAAVSATYDKKHVILVVKGENRLLFELEGYIFKKVKKE